MTIYCFLKWIKYLTNFSVNAVNLLEELTDHHVIVQNLQRKHQSNVCNLFEVNDKNIRTTSLGRSDVFSVNFEQVLQVFQNLQRKHQSNVCNLFEVNDKNIRTTSLGRSDVFSVNFEQVLHIFLDFQL